MRIFTVLRSGGEYRPVHVQALKRQIEAAALAAEFLCLSDVPVPGVECIQLSHDWPGWWAKMELFRPDLRGTIFYLDLDTVIAGPLDRLAEVTHLTVLRDFYRDGTRFPEGLGSGLMLLPEADRMSPWINFTDDPQAVMRAHPGGDQRFLERHYLHRADRWQDIVPGAVVSWKVHCQDRGGYVPKTASVICFHGEPRPWAIPKFARLYDPMAYIPATCRSPT